MHKYIWKFDGFWLGKIKHLSSRWHWYCNQMTLIGQPLFALISMAALAYFGRHTHDWKLMMAGGIAGGMLLFATGLKFLLRRNRPPTHYAQSMLIKTYSFPSGHAAASVSCYGLIAYLCLASGDPFIIATGVLLTPIIISIGLSRVYLGAHYPSDIVGGWFFGGLGLAAAIFVLQ